MGPTGASSEDQLGPSQELKDVRPTGASYEDQLGSSQALTDVGPTGASSEEKLGTWGPAEYSGTNGNKMY